MNMWLFGIGDKRDQLVTFMELMLVEIQLIIKTSRFSSDLIKKKTILAYLISGHER